MSYMTRFKELYFQRGAGGHFLASQCLWTPDEALSPNAWHEQERLDRNEYQEVMTKITRSGNNDTFVNEQFDIKSETKKILSVIENTMNEPVIGIPERVRIFHELTQFCDDGLNNVFTFDGIFNAIESFRYLEETLPDVWKVIENYFIQCKDHYYKLFEHNDWSLFTVTHKHPHSMLSSKLVLPVSMKTMAMKVDSVTDVYVRLLGDTKGNELQEPSWYETSHEGWNNKSAMLSDETVSYRKVFFDNDENEIKRLYDFCGNLEYFEENTTDIIKDFKQYHNANIQMLKNKSVYVPKEVHDIF